jgi:hypothetical protein
MNPKLQRMGESNGNAKLTARDVARIRKALTAGASTAALGHEFNVSQSTIMKVKLGYTWQHQST